MPIFKKRREYILSYSHIHGNSTTSCIRRNMASLFLSVSSESVKPTGGDPSTGLGYHISDRIEIWNKLINFPGKCFLLTPEA